MKAGDYMADTGNWIIDNLINALNTWNSMLYEIWYLVKQPPTNFKGGDIWNIIVKIHGSVQAVGLGLLVLFFVIGVMKTLGSFAEMKRPEAAFKIFIRFILAKAVITHGLELMLSMFSIVQGLMSKILFSSGIVNGEPAVLPQSIINAIYNTNFLESIPLWAVTIIGGLFIIVLSFIMIMSVYGRFFRIYIYTALAPVPLSTFAGEPTQNVGKSFIKSYCAVCLEGAVIVLAIVIFSAFASNPPAINTHASAVTQVWSYVGEIIFNMLVLVGTIKMADRTIKELMGL